MSKTIWVGAVAYNPKVVTIWEGMRRYFHEEAHLPVEVVLFQTYEAQVLALLALMGEAVPRIDIAWNTNLAYLQADEWSGHACRAVAMRDTDLGWMTKIVAVTGGSFSSLADLKGRTLAIGSRDSGHAAILPVHFLEQEGMHEGKDYRTLRFDSDVGKHGDTGTSEVEVVPMPCLTDELTQARLAVLSWETVRSERLVPEGSLREVWSSPAYSHCMFTARPDLDKELENRFVHALLSMSYDNPAHRPILEAEGLQRWLLPDVGGYGALRQAAAQQGFFEQLFAKPAYR